MSTARRHRFELETQIDKIICVAPPPSASFGGHIPTGGADLRRINFGSEAQRAERLVGRLGCGGDIDEHESLRIAAEARLQQVGQLGVAEGHVTLLVAQSHDDIACEASLVSPFFASRLIAILSEQMAPEKARMKVL